MKNVEDNCMAWFHEECRDNNCKTWICDNCYNE